MFRRPFSPIQLFVVLACLLSSASVPGVLRAQTGNVVVSTNTSWPAGSYTLRSLTVNSGAVLTVGGGSTVTVSGAVLVTANSSIVLQSVNNSSQSNGAWAGAGSTISAGGVQVDAGSSINADAQGYTISAGPGGAPQGNSAGGSYGGAGGGQSANTVYGSAAAPTDLGSGGGQYQGAGTNGGGAIRLIVSGTLTINGVISANGGSVGGFEGGGAGGSVYVTTNGLNGAGTFDANGGSNSSSYGNAGGGGRVAVYYGTATGFTGFNGSTATGGTVTGGGSAGGAGTVAFFNTSTSAPALAVYQNFAIPANANVTYASLAVSNGATLTVGGGATVTVTGTLTVTGKSAIVAQSVNIATQVNGAWAGTGATITAGSAQVDAGSSINADAQGYAIQAGPGAGAAGTSDGGSYGGVGGGQATATTYGSATSPVDLGSGGAQYQGTSAPGGGAIRLIVSGMLTNNGIISANGGGVAGFEGGGSGGSVWVTTQSLGGSGAFQANGGSNTSQYGNGGGGGRVAVYYSAGANYTGFAGSTATGGAVNGGGNAGGNGTTGFFDTSAANSNLHVYQNFVVPSGTTASYNSVTVAAGGITTLQGAATLIVAQTLDIAGTLYAQSVNTSGTVNGSYQGKGTQIVAANITVESTGTVTADSQGYAQMVGPGAGPSGSSNGGSYGGLGGGQPAATVYGSSTAPVDLGSGGGIYQGVSAPGGGAVQMDVSQTLTDNGVITANGGSVGGFSGGGSGGSIYVTANSVVGNGTVTANGGANSTSYGGGGGGGRIAIYYASTSTLSPANVTAAGGVTQGGSNGAAGTVVFRNQANSSWVQPTGNVIHGTTTLSWFTDSGASTTVLLAGPQTQVIAQATGSFSTQPFDTTQFPDGAYQLHLQVLGTSGQVVQDTVKDIVINNSVTWHVGTLTSSQEWVSTTVHALDGIVVVPAGVTLTIDPGTVIKAANGGALVVLSGGTVVALGGASNPVIFTTFDDYTAGGNTDFNQGITQPTPGEWNGVEVSSGGTFTTNANTIIRYAQTALTGTLGANTTLQSTLSYEVNGTLTVPSGVTLTMLPGTVVKMGSAAFIDMQPGSTLVANGTLAQPIYITSVNDNSVGSQASTATSTAPAPGDWNALIVDGATASLQYVQVQYGGGPVVSNAQAGMIETTDNAKVSISHSVIDNSYFIGLQTGYPNGGGDTVTVTDSVFYLIEDRAINTYPGSTVHVVNDTFDGNAGGVFNHGGSVDVENSVITNSINQGWGGIGICCGGTFTNLAYNDVYSAANVTNYVGYVDPTGTSGNISASPVYMNQLGHDYRPTYGSPLIDAADGVVTNYPATDYFGMSRFSDPLVATKTGVPDSTGAYADIGAFEFVQTAPSNLDLTVSNVQGPTTAVTGTQVTLSWTVTNIGTGTVYGPWHDGVYVVSDAGGDQQQVLAGEVLEGQGVTLGPEESYHATGTVTVPGVNAGTHRWEVKTNDRGEVFEGANTSNNTAIALDTVTTDMPQLIPGAGPSSGTLNASGALTYYKVVTTGPSQAVNVQATLQGVSQSSIQLFIGTGYVPSPQQFDEQSTEFDSAAPTVVIPAGDTQTYYVAVYAQQLSTVPASFNIQASTLTFSLTSVTPNVAKTTGSSTLTFVGGGFTTTTTFSLVGNGGTTYSPTSVFLSDAAHAEVTFDFTNFAQGVYAAMATNSSTLTLGNAVTVQTPTINYPVTPASAENYVSAWVDTPQAFRAGFPSLVTLHYQNTSGSDIPAPAIFLYASNASLAEVAQQCATCSASAQAQTASTFTSGIVLGISNQGPAGVLPAGQSGEIQFLATPFVNNSGTAPTSATFYVETIPDGIVKYAAVQIPPNCYGYTCPPTIESVGSYPDLDSFCNSLAPLGTSLLGATRPCMLLVNRAGFSFQTFPTFIGGRPAATDPYTEMPFYGFNQVLAQDATELSEAGVYEYDAQKLIAYELNKDGLDVFNHRYHTGAYGFGTSHPWDITYNGVYGYMSYPDGTARTFPTPVAGNPSLFLGQPGDYGTLSLNKDGTLTVTEVDGTKYNFGAAGGGVTSIVDRNGNAQTMTYGTSGSSPVVTAVTDSMGRSIHFQYDTTGHITQSTDVYGRTTTYTYDYQTTSPYNFPIITYAFLTSVTNARGTTTYKWNEGGSSGVGYIADPCVATYCESPIGITQITFPNGTHQYYTYDSAGRVTNVVGDLGAGSRSYTYNNNGTMTITDGLGHSTVQKSNFNGDPLAITDPLGNLTQFRFDGEGKTTTVTDPMGGQTLLSYDEQGNVNQLQSPTGRVTDMAFGATGAPASVTNPDGAQTTYTSDANGNTTSVTAPNGRSVQRTFDSHGRVTSITNKRGHTTQYSYAANGLVATKTLSNGTTYSYTYDGHNNLTSATTPAGTTNYTYDAADRLTQQTNPSGAFVKFTYNAGGQKASMTDSTGRTLNYAYDAAGRLSTMSSGGTAIVSYTYDANNNVTSKTLGNGATSALSYDVDGNVVSVTNKSPSGATLSQYSYQYNGVNDVTSIGGPAGTTTVSHDADGQITGVTAPGTSNTYAYDSNGDRTAETVNGTQIPVDTNNVDETTQIGTKANQYDADGNCTMCNGVGYTYDDDNRVTSMTDSSGSTTNYSYDATGAMVGAASAALSTSMLNDMTSGDEAVASVAASGQVIQNNFTPLATDNSYSPQDLVSTTQSGPAGGTNYYQFDGQGNTVDTTSASGATTGTANYTAYGDMTAQVLPTPFGYQGQSGLNTAAPDVYTANNGSVYNGATGTYQQSSQAAMPGASNGYSPQGNNPDPPEQAGLGGNDYFQVSGGIGFNVGLQVNLHTGDFALSIGAQTGGGGSAGFGQISGGPSGEARGEFTNGYLEGMSGNASAYTGFGGGVTGNFSGDASLEHGVGIGGHGGSINYGTVYHVGSDLQYGYDGLNQWTGGWLYGNDPDPDGNLNPSGRIFRCGKCYHPMPGPDGKILFLPKPGQSVPIQKGIDPNGKITSGYGNAAFLPPAAPIVYTVYFENQPTATAPAQIVTVTDQLSSNLDWSTVELQQIAFNNVTLALPGTAQSYTAQAVVTSDPNPVKVTAALNPTNGLLTWTMQSVDPVTGTAPANPVAGFLPPNTSSNQGVGSVTFSVQPLSGLANASTISNQASIVFDANAAIATNTVSNTLDSTVPTSSVNALPATTSTTPLSLSWSGSDANGSGVAAYTIFVAEDGGTATQWLTDTTSTSASYPAQAGHTYTFYSLAVNNVGTPQTAIVSPQTVAVSMAPPPVTVTPASGSVTSTQSLAVVVSVAAVNGDPTPTGSVVLSGGGYTSSAATLSSGAASLTIPAGALTPGNVTLTAAYTPDSGSTGNYAISTGSAMVIVNSATAPGVMLSTPALTFTAASGATSVAQTVTVNNNGNASLSITGITIGGTGAAEFAQTNNCGTSLTANASCTISVTFSPAAVTSYTATLAIVDNATGTPQGVTLTGTGTTPPAPAATLSASSLTFSANTGTSTAAQTITLTNSGNATLSISGITLTGAGGAAFAESTTCGTSLVANTSCTISVTFSPTAGASYGALLSIADNATGTPQGVTLTGTGTTPPAPAVTLSASSLTFTANTGTSTAAQTLTLTNSGNASLSISGITIGGAGASSFADTTTCGTSLATNTSCTIALTFTPVAVANYSALLSIADNATGTPQSVTLIGTGTAPPAPVATITPASLTFTAPSGTTSAAQTVTLKNTGNAPLNFTSITLTGTGAASFAETSSCSTTLLANASCTVSVNFSPSSTTAFAASLVFTDNAAGSTQTVSLTGTGSPAPTFTFAVSPTSQTVNRSDPASYTLTVTGQGGAFQLPVTFSVSGLPNGVTPTFSPVSVTPGSGSATSTMTVPTSSLLAMLGPPKMRRSGLMPVTALACLLSLPMLFRRRRKIASGLLVLVLFVATATFTGCGTSRRLYQFTVTASSSASGAIPAESQTVTVTLTVQ